MINLDDQMQKIQITVEYQITMERYKITMKRYHGDEGVSGPSTDVYSRNNSRVIYFSVMPYSYILVDLCIT